MKGRTATTAGFVRRCKRPLIAKSREFRTIRSWLKRRLSWPVLRAAPARTQADASAFLDPGYPIARAAGSDHPTHTSPAGAASAGVCLWVPRQRQSPEIFRYRLRSLRGRRSRSETGGKRAQFVSAFEDCSSATAGKTGAEWDFSPPVAADGLLPRRLLTIALPQPLGLRKLRQLKDAFEDSDLPICVDIVDWSLADADFKAAVEAQGMATLQ